MNLILFIIIFFILIISNYYIFKKIFEFESNIDELYDLHFKYNLDYDTIYKRKIERRL